MPGPGSIVIPAPPSGVLARLRWAVADGATVVRRNVAHLKHQPGELLAALIAPAVMVLLFGYVFGSAISVPGGGNYRAYLIPGLFAMTGFTSLMVTTENVAADAENGIMDRFRSMPVARLAVPFGQTGYDLLMGAFALIVMTCCGLAVGWRIHNGAAHAAAAYALLILMQYAVLWAAVFLGLVVKSREIADRLGPLVFPLTMLSNTFVPTNHMPAWLRVIIDWNPVSSIVAACRDLFGNAVPAAGHLPLPLQHPVAASLAWSLLLLAVFMPLSVRRFRTRQ